MQYFHFRWKLTSTKTIVTTSNLVCLVCEVLFARAGIPTGSMPLVITPVLVRRRVICVLTTSFLNFRRYIEQASCFGSGPLTKGGHTAVQLLVSTNHCRGQHVESRPVWLSRVVGRKSICAWMIYIFDDICCYIIDVRLREHCSTMRRCGQQHRSHDYSQHKR